jgi:superfamily I DNA/RNA helicase
MLIGELIPIALRFLQANPHARVLPAYKAVLVDEFQDLNKADQALVDVLATNANLTVVGDDNQSIYRFRHANPEGIRVFPAEHAGTSVHAIEDCWRCPPNIVAMSNALLAHDPSARQAPLRAQLGRADASLYVVQHPSIGDEADAIAAYIDSYLNRRNGLPAGQVLVLSPRRIFGNAIRDALIRRRRNALSFFWEDAFDADAAAEGFCLLTLLVSPDDRAAYRAWLGLGDADGNRAGYSRVRGYAEEHEVEPFAVCEELSSGRIELRYTERLVQRHKHLKTRLAALAGLTGIPLVNALWDAANSESLTIRLAAAAVATNAPEPQDLHQGLAEAITQPELPDSAGDVIRVMSLHKAKGLTAELVVIAGCVGGAIPTVDERLSMAEQDAVLKEQRRLFYVAITRARDTLVLSSVTQAPLPQALRANIPPAGIYRYQGNLYARLAASPFIDELGATCPRAIKGSDWRAGLNF